jgi:hypothetical protein
MDEAERNSGLTYAIIGVRFLRPDQRNLTINGVSSLVLVHASRNRGRQVSTYRGLSGQRRSVGLWAGAVMRVYIWTILVSRKRGNEGPRPLASAVGGRDSRERPPVNARGAHLDRMKVRGVTITRRQSGSLRLTLPARAMSQMVRS